MSTRSPLALEPTGVLYVDGKEVDGKSVEHTTPVTFAEDESFDIGQDTRTGVAMLEQLVTIVITASKAA